jgi:hypothetical protein
LTYKFGSFIFIQALVEKDWLGFGHPFSDRIGMPTISGSGNVPYELSRQSSTGSFPASPMRQSSASQGPSSTHAQTSNNYSPIFLQVCALITYLGQTHTHTHFHNAESLEIIFLLLHVIGVGIKILISVFTGPALSPKTRARCRNGCQT